MVKYRSPLLPLGFLRAKPRSEMLAHLRTPRELRRMLKDALAATGSTGCSIWELQQLRRSLLHERPRHAVELGSGVSTLVLAFAVRELQQQGHECRFVSLEQSAEYQNDMLQWFPKDLAPFVRFVLSPAGSSDFPDGRRGFRYSYLPDEAYEWVFVDGPQLPRKDPMLFDADAIDIARHGQRMVIHVDGRESTVERLVERLRPAHIERFPIHSWTTMRVDGRQAR